MRVGIIAALTAIAACGGSALTSPPDASTMLCTPNRSVACVGAGGCAGGQACNAEGSGYLPCDCGSEAEAAAPGDASTARESASAVDAQHSLDATMEGGDAADSGACASSTPPAANGGTHLSDPTPTETTSSSGYVLHKTLSGYGNYGEGDGTADIVYAGGVGAWTFAIPAGTISSATVVLSVAADDGASGQASGYAFDLWSNACGPFANTSDFQHGAPFNGHFTDWTPLTFPAELTPGGTYVVTIANTTALDAGDSLANWIGIEWIEVRVTAP